MSEENMFGQKYAPARDLVTNKGIACLFQRYFGNHNGSPKIDNSQELILQVIEIKEPVLFKSSTRMFLSDGEHQFSVLVDDTVQKYLDQTPRIKEKSLIKILNCKKSEQDVQIKDSSKEQDAPQEIILTHIEYVDTTQHYLRAPSMFQSAFQSPDLPAFDPQTMLVSLPKPSPQPIPITKLLESCANTVEQIEKKINGLKFVPIPDFHPRACNDDYGYVNVRGVLTRKGKITFGENRNGPFIHRWIELVGCDEDDETNFKAETFSLFGSACEEIENCKVGDVIALVLFKFAEYRYRPYYSIKSVDLYRPSQVIGNLHLTKKGFALQKAWKNFLVQHQK